MMETITTTPSTKKNSLCRYFIRYGDCFHGDMCQYVHAYPPEVEQTHPNESTPQPSRQIPPSYQTPTQTPQHQPYQNNHQHQQLQQSQQQPQLQSQAPLLQQHQPQPQNQGYKMSKLVCSFKSDLPNEIDFAMQVATILANTDNFTWYKDYPLVDAICSSLHVFVCVCDDLSNCYCYPRFWRKILTKNSENQALQAATTPPDMDQSYLNFNALKNHDFEDHNKIYRRIKTAAELLKQFSMTIGIPKAEDDQTEQSLIKKKKLKASPPLLKFVSLLVHCDNAALNLLGLDILSNTASKLCKILEVVDDSTCSKLVQMFQEYCVDSICRPDGDIYIVNRSVEVVSRLISSKGRVLSSMINQITEKNLILRLEQFLTSHYDVTLFLSALECFYKISRHQPYLITAVRTKYFIKILVNLLDWSDSRYFTPNALKRIKIEDSDENCLHPNVVIETGGMNNHATAEAATTTTSATMTPARTTATTTPASPAPVAPTSTSTSTSASTPAQTSTSTSASTPAQTSTSTSTSIPAPAPAPAPTSTSTSTSTPTQTSTSTTTPTPTLNQNSVTPAPIQTPIEEYKCEWSDCNEKFEEAKRVYTHVFEVHVSPLAPDALSTCLWSSPNGSGPGCLTKRPKYSLLTHLNDFHCNPTALERALNRSQPIKPPEHPGYAPNAALLAIKRHANSHIEGKNGTENNHDKSPLSISVRLTSALILRNLATESPEIKQALENHEPLLSEICMSNGRDEAKIIAECLSLFSNE